MRWLTLTSLLLLASTASTVQAHDPIDRDIVELTQQLAAAPQNVDLLLSRAWLWGLENRLAEALADLDLADALRPRSVEAAVLRARIYASAGRAREAEAVLDALSPSQLTHDALAVRALLREGAGRLRGALDDYERAEAITCTIDTTLGRGRVLRRLGRAHDAVGAYREALDELAGAAVVRLALIDVLGASGRHTEALREIEVARRSARITTRWDLRQANVLQAMDRGAEARRVRQSAVTSLRDQLAARPTAARWVLMGRALQSLGRMDEARAAADRALVLAPRLRDARVLQAEIGEGAQ